MPFSSKNIVFRQLFERETSSYTYLIMDLVTKEALIIDPVLETAERDLKLIEELGAHLKYTFDTHVHADHITASGELKKHTGAQNCASAQSAPECADIKMNEGEVLKMGEVTFKALETPGHTNSCMSLYSPELGAVFTGDSLMIRGNGRTDFQQGSSEKLFQSIQNKLYKLPSETTVYPGHDYRGYMSSTIGEEKNFNPRISEATSLKSFVQTMDELKLAPPRHIHTAVPANMACGNIKSSLVFKPQVVDGLPEVTPQILNEELKRAFYIDVRGRDEWTGEFGYIPGAKLVTLGPDLEDFMKGVDKDKEIVFICRSGGRSARATSVFRQLGYKNAINLQGGMSLWSRLGFKTQKSLS